MAEYSGQGLREYLFGSWDRTYSFIACILGLLSIILTLVLWTFPESIPQLIIIRDLVVFFGLLLIAGILLSKYVKKENHLLQVVARLNSSNQLLTTQFNNFHSIVHKYRNRIFKHFLAAIPEDIPVSLKDKEAFESICHSVTTEVRKIFTEYFQSKNIIIGDDIHVTIKLVFSTKTLLDLYNKLSPQEADKIKKKDQWVITAFRDPGTFEHLREREVGAKIYDIDKNTAFIHIIKEKKDKFANDNLKELGDAYLNENNDWEKYYNSAIVVPIRYYNKETDHYLYFGLLAIDSLNKERHKLYDNVESKFIAGHAADLLANFFLSLALHQCEPVRN